MVLVEAAGTDLERLKSVAFSNVSVEAGGMVRPDERSQGVAGPNLPTPMDESPTPVVVPIAAGEEQQQLPAVAVEEQQPLPTATPSAAAPTSIFDVG